MTLLTYVYTRNISDFFIGGGTSLKLPFFFVSLILIIRSDWSNYDVINDSFILVCDVWSRFHNTAELYILKMRGGEKKGTHLEEIKKI